MTTPLRLVLIEDSDTDADLLLRELTRAGYDPVCRRVETAEAFHTALAQGPWDLVISDFYLPSFGAPAALAMLQRSGIDLPFVIVSGHVGEDAAVDAMRAGAHDYVMKHSLSRLAPAIERELRDARERARRRDAEASLNAARGKYEALVNSLDGIVWEARTNPFRYVFVSRQAEQVLGYHPDRWIDDPQWWERVVAPEDLDAVRAFRTAAAEGRGERAIDYRVTTADGRTRWMQDIVTLAIDTAGPTLRGVTVDMTDRKKAEQDIVQAAKLESLGLLAGGIAHDFNNMLTAIVGNLSLVRLTLQDQRAADRLKAATSICLKAKDLTHQLLTFSKGGTPMTTTVSLAPLLEESVEFALRGSRIQAETRLPPDLWPVEIDPGQISQVINNLLINAQQAMPNGGRLTVSARNVHSRSEHSVILPYGRYVKIVVADQGAGISATDLPKIFDPFFTTKTTGTGLGLATSYSIIKKHRGQIAVESSVGIGTTFSVYLPASAKAPSEHEPMPTGPAFGSGRLLFMDDDPAIRDVVVAVLAHYGYAVECAPNGQAAVTTFGEAYRAGRPYDAVVLDLTVKGGEGGVDTFKQLKAIDPEVKGIVSSGYADDPVMVDYAAYGFRARLNKPYRIEDLTAVLADIVRPTLPADRRSASLHASQGRHEAP